MQLRSEHLDALPRLGWVQEATPITPIPSVATELGLGWFGVKRDDLCAELHGGTKVRKLDFVLADPRLVDAPSWASVGAIGSGHLATLTAAAEELGRRLLALTFWEPLGPWVEENLAYTASGPTELRYFPNRVTLALRHPRALTAARFDGRAVIAPGASCPVGVLGMVRAGLELAEQIRDEVLPEPDRIYLPLGSGGAVAGLSLGLALGGFRPRLHAVAAVEFPFAQAGRLEALARGAEQRLRDAGVELPDGSSRAPIEIDRRMLGRGYGHATPASLRERDSFEPFGLGLEPIYGGKAMAALHEDAGGAAGERVLFWHTSHSGSLPHAADWEDRLPLVLQRRLAAARSGRVDRRRFIGASLAAVAALAIGARVGLHASIAGWEGNVLFEWEGAVLAAAAEALIPDTPGGTIPGGVPPSAIAVNVDRYLLGMPQKTRTEVHGLFTLVEHGTGLDRNVLRFTRLSAEARRDFVATLGERDDELGQAAKGLRDFVYLGYYQDRRAWPALAYRGPWVDGVSRPSPYDALVAPSGARPRGIVT